MISTKPRGIFIARASSLFLIFIYAVSCSSPGEKDLITIPSAHAKSKESKSKDSKSSGKSKKESGAKTPPREPAIIDSPPVRKLQQSQAKRFEKIQHYKYRKFIGEAIDGTLKVVESARIPASETKDIRKLVADENKDREALYKMIIKANTYDKDMEKILRESFFNSYREWDPTGAFFFVDGVWQQ